MFRKSTIRCLLLGFLFCASLLVFVFPASSSDLDSWKIDDWGGGYEEVDGMFHFWGRGPEGVALYKDFVPQEDFEVSMQMKASTLGLNSSDPAGEGIALLIRSQLPIVSNYGVNLELRARGGGQFLLTHHNDLSDIYHWSWDWTPFVYNSLNYNNGYFYWYGNHSIDRSNSIIKPNVWYTMKLKVQQAPFVITAEVLTENGTLLGSFAASDMNNFTFEQIKFVGIGTGWGGEFFVRNFTIQPLNGARLDQTPAPPALDNQTITHTLTVSPAETPNQNGTPTVSSTPTFFTDSPSATASLPERKLEPSYAEPTSISFFRVHDNPAPAPAQLELSTVFYGAAIVGLLVIIVLVGVVLIMLFKK